MAKNDNCAVSDSSICKWIGKEDCAGCYINGLKADDDAAKALEGFEVTLSLLPENFDDLQSEHCQFCTKEPRPAAGFAVIDLAHSEPESKRGMFFGMGKKVRQRVGSLMPVSISICKPCRRAMRITEMLKWLGFVVLVGLALILLSVPSIGTAVSAMHTAMPIVVVVVAGLLGYVAGRLASNAYRQAKSAEVRFNVFDIPVCRDMQAGGWFTLQEDGPFSRFIFSKKSSTKKIKDIRTP